MGTYKWQCAFRGKDPDITLNLQVAPSLPVSWHLSGWCQCILHWMGVWNQSVSWERQRLAGCSLGVTSWPPGAGQCQPHSEQVSLTAFHGAPVCWSPLLQLSNPWGLCSVCFRPCLAVCRWQVAELGFKTCLHLTSSLLLPPLHPPAPTICSPQPVCVQEHQAGGVHDPGCHKPPIQPHQESAPASTYVSGNWHCLENIHHLQSLFCLKTS
jgi:hypothetical protein